MAAPSFLKKYNVPDHSGKEKSTGSFEPMLSGFVGDWLIVTPAVAFAVQNADIILLGLVLSHSCMILLVGVVGFVVWIMLIRISIQLLPGMRFAGNAAFLSHRLSPFSTEADASELR